MTSFVRLISAVMVVAAVSSFGCNRDPAVTAQSTNSQTLELKAAPSLATIVDSNFDDIKFEMEQTDVFEQSMLTPKVEELVGKRIRIRGYILPTSKKMGLKHFVLVRDNLECCFGPGAALYDCILVHMKEGKTAEFSIRPVAVEGTFQFEEFRDFDGVVRAIYRLDGEAVE